MSVVVMNLGQFALRFGGERRFGLGRQGYRGGDVSLKADFSQSAQDAGGPAIDVELEDLAAHELHALSAFIARHLKAAVHGIGNAGGVVRIDEEGIAQLDGCAGEAAEDQDALFIFAGGDVLLGDEVHAVMERGDEAKVSDAIPAGDFFVAALPLNEHDGPPVRGLIALIDAGGGFFHAVLEVSVAGNAGAAGGCNLHEGEALPMPWVLLEQFFKGEHALFNALCVVHAIDPECDDFSAHAELGEELLAERGADGFGLCIVGVVGRDDWQPFEGDADGKRTHGGDMTVTAHGHLVPVGARLDGAVDGREKVIAMQGNVEADEVSAEETIEELSLPGADTECLRIGPGDMPEDGDAGIGARILDEARQESEVVVLHKDDGLGAVLHLLE